MSCGRNLFTMRISYWLILGGTLNCLLGTEAFSSQEKVIYKHKVQEMFSHAFNSYMDHAYPADELMPLTCKGRVRGRDRNRGDIDDALGMFSLTLVDSLDTLAVLGRVDEFNSAIRTIVRDVSFDTDLVVSVFETNIRVLGGLLGAHFAAEALKQSHPQLSWYKGHLLQKAIEVGRRLLPAFNTSTGLPYPKVNLRRGMGFNNVETTTCTACAGTLLMEFAALSRLTGDPEYELKAHHAMDVLWQNRHHGHNLLGSVINVHNGEWTRRDSGVGAGSDSYYEYVLKSYILLGDEEYLKRFQMHYGAIKKYISNGPMLVDVSMNSPNRMTRSYMDSLLAFWPGLQVLWGDVDAAIQTHDMLYHVTEKHNFLPEAFTMDFRVHWGNHPLRPEFSESTYFLYKATKDPYYLDVGKTIVDNLNEYARVSCGFAAIKDLRNNEHEDRMDSFVLAETFKYLFLLFAEEEDVLLDMDDFVFTTEAHLFPLSLSSANVSARQATKAAHVVRRATPTPTQTPPLPSNQAPPSSEAPLPSSSHSSPETSQSQHSSNDDSSQSKQTNTYSSSPPHPPPPSPTSSSPSSSSSSSSSSSMPPAQPQDLSTVLTMDQLQCSNDRRSFVLQDQFQKVVLRQCTSSRFRIRPAPKKTTPPRLDVRTLDFGNPEQVRILSELGIVVEPMGNGKVHISHMMQKAKTPEDAEEGWYLMQDIMKLMNEQKKMQEEAEKTKRQACLVRILDPVTGEQSEFEAGPALFGPALGRDLAGVAAELYILTDADGVSVATGCEALTDVDLEDRIVMVVRGGCLFVQKVRNAQRAKASGVIIADNIDVANSGKGAIPFSMSGDGLEDIDIPSVFLKKNDAIILQSLVKEVGEVLIEMVPVSDQEKKEQETSDAKKEPVENIEEDKKEENSDLEEEAAKDRKNSDDVHALSWKVQSLLEELNVDQLPDELKESVSRELGKLKALNSNIVDPSADSCSATSKDSLMKTVADQLDSLKESYSGEPLRISQEGEITGGKTGTLNFKTSGKQQEGDAPFEEGTPEISSASVRSTGLGGSKAHENKYFNSDRTSSHDESHDDDTSTPPLSGSREPPGPD